MYGIVDTEDKVLPQDNASKIIFQDWTCQKSAAVSHVARQPEKSIYLINGFWNACLRPSSSSSREYFPGHNIVIFRIIVNARFSTIANASTIKTIVT
jgi:hypothetical protein